MDTSHLKPVTVVPGDVGFDITQQPGTVFHFMKVIVCSPGVPTPTKKEPVVEIPMTLVLVTV